MNRDILRAELSDLNVQAFARVVREGESSQTASAYRMRYGGAGNAPKFFDDLSRHPKVFERTPDGLMSSAAGAYQATWTTWIETATRWGLPDFSEASQDEFFVARLIFRDALGDVKAGRFEEACRKCATEWTSLPGGKEENAATKRARATWDKWREILAAAQPDPLATEHYGETVTESTINPVPSADEQEANMASFLAAIIPTLIQAAPDLIRFFGKGERSEQNAVIAEKAAALAVQVTGAINEQEAARVLATNPAKAQEYRAAVADNFDQWMGMVVKFREMDETSRKSARDFVTAYGRSPVAGKLTFVELLSLVFVIVAAIGGGFVLVNPFDKFTTEMQTAVVMLMLIGGWNGVKEFWLGSSMGSMKKDDRAAAQTER